jgi:hypothetical protein
VVCFLRGSFLRGTPMTEDATVHFKNLKCYEFSFIYNPEGSVGVFC